MTGWKVQMGVDKGIMVCAMEQSVCHVEHNGGLEQGGGILLCIRIEDTTVLRAGIEIKVYFPNEAEWRLYASVD